MTHGAIAASDPQTAEAGARMLRRGGNAVDAAVAAAFASFVAEFSLVNIGGGGIATLMDSRTHEAVTYDFFSDMPSGSLPDDADFRQVWVDFGATRQPFFIGRASVAVPGVVAGLCTMARAHGTLPLSMLLEPAIQLARNGVTISPPMAYAYELLQPIFRDTPEIEAIFVPGGRVYQAGEVIRLPQLAASLTQLSQQGPDLFYRGALARAIVDDQQTHGGIITAADLADYRVHSTDPIRLAYRDCTILLPPPSSIGGVLIGFALRLLDSVELNRLPHNGSRHLRVLAEVMRLTNRARHTWEQRTDAAWADDAARVAWFLSDAAVADSVEMLHAVLHGSEPPADPPAVPGPSSTTHISVADAQGQLVSITTSAGECAGFVVGDTGICLNNMLGELDLHPNGFHKLAPGTRLTTMMTPTLVVRAGRPILAVGSGGSNRIRSAIVQTISNVVDFHLSPEAAVTASRIHFEEGVIQLEGGIPSAVATELRDLGYTVNAWPAQNMFFGGAHIVNMIDGHPIPAGDPRRGGSTAMVT